MYIADYHGRVRHDVIRHVPRSNGAILDIGGGNGATASAMKACGYRKAVVIDMVDKDDVAPPIDTYIQADLSDPSVTANTIEHHGPFDTILCLDILEHLSAPETLLAAVYQQATPGCHVVVSLPNVSHYTASFPLFFGGKWEYQDNGVLDRTHLRFFTRETATHLVRNSGFVIQGVYPTESTKPAKIFVKKMLRIVSVGLLNRFVDQGYIILAQRPETQ